MAKQIKELKEIVRAAGSHLVYLPKIVLAVELKLKRKAKAAKVARRDLPSNRQMVSTGKNPIQPHEAQGFLF